MRTVSAVVLTYNRKVLLSECLDAIAAQSRPVERIIVIDNAGTDGTAEWLAEEWGDRVELYRLPTNVGSSGGFSMAMRVGYERGDDAIWLMDDDVIPAPDALERLMEAETTLASRKLNAPYVISTAWTPDGQLTNVPSVDRKRNRISYENWPILLEEGMAPVRRATFVSILLKRETIRDFGLPMADMFMWGEDTEYTRRITRHHPGYIVGKSRVVHVRYAPGVLSIKTENNPDRVRLHYHLRRNRMFIKRQGGWKPAATAMYYQSKSALRLLLKGERQKAWVVFSGSVAGLTFRPRTQGVDIPCDLDGLRVRSGGMTVSGNARAA